MRLAARFHKSSKKDGEWMGCHLSQTDKLMVQLLIVDDHPMVQEGIRALLQPVPHLHIVGVASDAPQALALLRAHAVNVALLDINLPGTDGIELCRQICQDFPQAKVLGMSSFKERSYIARMLGAGALGYVLKSVDQATLLQAIDQVAAGKFYLEAELAQVLAQNGPPASLPVLTRREKEVLACIAQGLTNAQIADKLFVSPLTVDSHRKNLLTKLGVKNTASLIKFAMENGLL